MARQLLKCSVGKEGGIEGQVGRWTPGVGSGGLVDTWGWLRWAGGHLGLAHVGRWAPEVGQVGRLGTWAPIVGT
eukprot:scaffold60547_cov19-Tisochrysis_lutea.AAC.1